MIRILTTRKWEPILKIRLIILLSLLAFILSSCGLLQDLFNRPPVAVIRASPASGFAPLKVEFDGSNSYDPDGRIIRFHWDFGDGQTAGEKAVSYTYKVQGDFTATLTVTDDDGAKAKARVTIAVGPPLPR